MANIEITYVDGTNVEKVGAAIKKNTKVTKLIKYIQISNEINSILFFRLFGNNWYNFNFDKK